MENGIILNWIPPVIIACIFIGTMSGIAGILSKTISPASFLFFVGMTWIPYFAFMAFNNETIFLRISLLTCYTMILGISTAFFLASNPEVKINEICLLIFCGIISAIGNHALFTAVSLAGKYSGFPLVAFSLQSIFALFISLAFINGGTYAVTFVGLENFKAGISTMNYKHYLAILMGLGSVVMFNFAGKIE